VNHKNTVRAEPVEAHSPFDKAFSPERSRRVKANGLQTSAPAPVDVSVLRALVALLPRFEQEMAGVEHYLEDD